MSDMLQRATAAYGAEPIDHGCAAVTRGRVLRAHARTRRPRWALRVCAWLAGASLFGATAMAAVTGQGPSALIERVTAMVYGQAPAPTGAGATRARAKAATAQQTRASAATGAQARAHEPAIGGIGPALRGGAMSSGAVAARAAATGLHSPIAAVAPAARRAPAGLGRAPSARSSWGGIAPALGGGAMAIAPRASPQPDVSSTVPTDPELGAFREAYDVHAHSGDLFGAVMSWEHYLRDFPDGRFALEARYNLAIALARSGRFDAAQDALEPFALGTHGEYRQREARALLNRLKQSAADGGSRHERPIATPLDSARVH